MKFLFQHALIPLPFHLFHILSFLLPPDFQQLYLTSNLHSPSSLKVEPFPLFTQFTTFINPPSCILPFQIYSINLFLSWNTPYIVNTLLIFFPVSFPQVIVPPIQYPCTILCSTCCPHLLL